MSLSEEEYRRLRAEAYELERSYYDDSELKEIRKKYSVAARQLKDADNGFWTEANEHIGVIDFLVGEVWSEDESGELRETTDDEIADRIELLRKIVKERDSQFDGLWLQWVEGRAEELEHQRNEWPRRRKIDARMQEINKLAPPRTVWSGYIDRGDDVPYNAQTDRDESVKTDLEDSFLMEKWNYFRRRIEYHNPGENFELLKPHHTLEEFQELRDDPWGSEIVGWHMEPHEELSMEIEGLHDRIRWLEIDLDRTHRKKTNEIAAKDEDAKTLYRLAKQANLERSQAKPWWHRDMASNIEMLTEMEMEGHVIDILFNPRDDHVQRDLCVRFGVDVGRATRTRFAVKYYSHMNNFIGSLMDFAPHKDVILGLNIDRRNKINLNSPEMNTYHAKTVLRPMDEADKYLELENKHLPGGVGYRKYRTKDLIAAHYKIMAELYPKTA